MPTPYMHSTLVHTLFVSLAGQTQPAKLPFCQAIIGSLPPAMILVNASGHARPPYGPFDHLIEHVDYTTVLLDNLAGN